MAAYLNLASAALTPRYRRLRAFHVPPLPQRHASDRHRSIRFAASFSATGLRDTTEVQPRKDTRSVQVISPVGGLRLLYIYLAVVIDHSLVIVEIARAFGRLLQLPAQPFLRLGHRRDCRELLQQGVPPEGTLNRQRGVPRLHAAVLPLQHLDLLVEQILRQLVPVETRRL